MKLITRIAGAGALLLSTTTLVPAEELKTLGLAVAQLEANFFNQIRQAVEAEAGERGIKVLTVDAKDDSATQISQVQDLITQGVDALIYIPAGAAAANVPVKLAQDAGIPVINVDRNAEGAPGDTFIASDSVASAKAVCTDIIEKAGGKGKMAVIMGQKGTTPQVDRWEGCEQALAEYPEVEVIATQYTNRWGQDEGFQIMQDMLQVHPDITIVFGQADKLALGAAQAVKVASLPQEVFVAGFDGDTAALEALANGTFAVTATQQTQRMGRLAVESAVKLVAGEDIPAEQLLEATLTTEENVQGFIENHP